MQTIDLQQGGGIRITGEGTVELQALSGSIELEGTILSPEPDNATCVYITAGDVLQLYTMDGGRVQVQSRTPTIKVETYAAEPAQWFRALRALGIRHSSITGGGGGNNSTSGGGLRIACFSYRPGDSQLAARTLCNTLARTTIVPPIYCDLDPCSNNNNYNNNAMMPQSLCCVEVSRDTPLITGSLWSCQTEPPLAYFLGTNSLDDNNSNDSTKDNNNNTTSSTPDRGSLTMLYQHIVGLTVDSATWLSRHSNNNNNNNNVVDATGYGAAAAAAVVFALPITPAGARADVFIRRVLEIVRPTHVLIVGAEEAAQQQQSSLSLLRDDLARSMPHVEFLSVGELAASIEAPSSAEALTNTSSGAIQDPSLRPLYEYFLGNPCRPLGCTKASVKLSAVKVVTLRYEDTTTTTTAGQPQQGVKAVLAPSSAEALSQPGTVCALSQATSLSACPYASIYGIVVVASVNAERDELVLVMPGTEPVLPSGLLLVGSAIGARAAGYLFSKAF